MLLRLAPMFAALLACPAAAEIALSGQSLGVELVAMGSLPAAPPDTGDTEACAHLFVDSPATPAGKLTQSLGWKLTSELALGDLTAVSFAGSASFVGSGACDLYDGNVGIFAGDTLVALLYGTNRDDLMIGRLRPFGDGLRVLTGDALASTSVDLRLEGGTVILSDPAKEEPVCNGAAIIPDVEGFPIDEARKSLADAGWVAVPGDPELQSLGMAAEIARLGVPEVVDCSGTGFGFCLYGYQGPAGGLTVVTAGEGGESGGLPLVSSYEVTCN